MSDALEAAVKTADIFGELNKLFGTNKTKETNGIVIKFGKLHVRIARMGAVNKKFKAVFERESEPYRALIANGMELPEDVSKSIVMMAYAEAILLEWGMEQEDGTYKELPYVAADGVKAFEAQPDFLQLIVNESQKAANFRDKVAETEEKN